MMTQINKKLIAKKLIYLRGKKSRKEVAKAVGISLSAIKMYENAKRSPKDEIKIRLASYYDVSIEQLFFSHDGHVSCSA